MRTRISEETNKQGDKKRISIFDMEDVLNFGKYTGESIQDVLGVDPDYLAWCHDNIEWFELEEKLYDAIRYSNKQYNNPGVVSEYNPHGNPQLYAHKKNKEKKIK